MQRPRISGVVLGIPLRRALGMLGVFCLLAAACNKDGPGSGSDGTPPQDGARKDAPLKPTCPPPGTDKDGDGYGEGCPAGDDCDDGNSAIYPGAPELCDGVDNDCDDKLDEGCGTIGGDDPFPIDPSKTPELVEATNVGLDGNGDLVLTQSKTSHEYMWIANTDDLDRGTLSKIDTVNLKEVARYFTVTCHSKAGAGGCVDLHGKPINKLFGHNPSRTAVDYNFDVWVANRAFDGQPSATKIANEAARCVDRDKSGTIETSQDRDGDGKITVDCNNDGNPDDRTVTCTAGALAGKPPEFYGDDDECIVVTVNFGENTEIGRSVCLDNGFEGGASNVWVGTYDRTVNRFYRIDANSYALAGPYELALGHHVYGCVIDSKGILWSVDDSGVGGGLTYLNTLKPTEAGPVLEEPWGDSLFYGIAVDGQDRLWLGGWDSGRVFRYTPDRTGFATLDKGTWAAVTYPKNLAESRGIAADDRGKIWVAINNGYILRLDQSVPDGLTDQSALNNYWQVTGTTVIGVGVDFNGNIWGISYDGDVASRLDVDSKGDVIQPATGLTKKVPVGDGPYTYSDFTGFGLRTFTRPEGKYVYRFSCANNARATWSEITWKATTPAGTSINVRARAGESATALGQWISPVSTSPASLQPGLSPNPARLLEVEVTLKTNDKKTSPVLQELTVAHSCVSTPG